MSDPLKRFYKSRVKKPDLFTYDDNGDLIEKNKEGNVIKTLALPIYRKPTFEEIDEMEKKRMEAIAVSNKQYDDARKELHNLISRPDVSDSDIIRANRKVTESDILLQNIRFPLRYIYKEGGVNISDIDFTQLTEKRKLPYEISILQTRPFNLQDQYVRIGQVAKKPLISVAEAKEMNESNIPVILFYEPDTNEYGYLSLKWPVELEFNSTMYHSAYQAILAEIAKSFNDQENLKRIMLSETADEITYTMEDVPGDKEINETKWNDLFKQLIYDINNIKFNQYPELSNRLLETKNAILGAYEPDDNLIGIGLSLDNIQSKNPINWTGQNILGKALMDIRNKIQTDRAIKLQETAVSVAPIQPPKSASVARPPRKRQVIAPALPQSTVPQSVETI
jgi:ribA/ribD-fused uncharacterized protein